MAKVLAGNGVLQGVKVQKAQLWPDSRPTTLMEVRT